MLTKKSPDTSDLVKKRDFNSEITGVQGKIPSSSGLATNSKLTAVEDKIPGISGIVTKTNYNTKTSEIEKNVSDHNHDKYITTPEFNRLTRKSFKARLAQQNLITKTDFDT